MQINGDSPSMFHRNDNKGVLDKQEDNLGKQISTASLFVPEHNT
jgi:hypothetical protein